MPYAEYSQAELKIPVTISPFSQFQPEQKFDLITMFHVLEHLENPVLDLAHLGQFLNPGGHFIIEVPNITIRGHGIFAQVAPWPPFFFFGSNPIHAHGESWF